MKELSPVWLRSVSPGASALRSLSQCASAWPELFPGFQSARRIERSLAATGSSQNTVSQLARLYIIFFFQRKRGMERHTHKAQDGKDEEGDGGQAQQPAPAQSGHHQDGQEDLKHGAQSPKYLQNRSIFSKHCWHTGAFCWCYAALGGAGQSYLDEKDACSSGLHRKEFSIQCHPLNRRTFCN